MSSGAVLTCLSIDAPWAWAIIKGHKRWENRSWATTHRGRLGIHCTKSTRSDGAAGIVFAMLGIEPPTLDELDELRGRLIGEVQLIDCVPYESLSGGLFADLDGETARDPFCQGPVCWQLESPIEYAEKLETPGKQRLWQFQVRAART